MVCAGTRVVPAQQPSAAVAGAVAAALLSELLRNSQATLAIASYHGIELKALVRHEDELTPKIDQAEEKLAEVEDVLLKCRVTAPPPSV
jgi:hypothetical protein